jgi:hypothetical protein
MTPVSALGTCKTCSSTSMGYFPRCSSAKCSRMCRLSTWLSPNAPSFSRSCLSEGRYEIHTKVPEIEGKIRLNDAMKKVAGEVFKFVFESVSNVSVPGLPQDSGLIGTGSRPILIHVALCQTGGLAARVMLSPRRNFATSCAVLAASARASPGRKAGAITEQAIAAPTPTQT